MYMIIACVCKCIYDSAQDKECVIVSHACTFILVAVASEDRCSSRYVEVAVTIT